jgi:hypothetical protein
MIDNNHELTIGELDAVSGGMLFAVLLGNIVNKMQKAQGGGSGEPGPQNDPLAQMFQQLLQQPH